MQSLLSILVLFGFLRVKSEWRIAGQPAILTIFVRDHFWTFLMIFSTSACSPEVTFDSNRRDDSGITLCHLVIPIVEALGGSCPYVRDSMFISLVHY